MDPQSQMILFSETFTKSEWFPSRSVACKCKWVKHFLVLSYHIGFFVAYIWINIHLSYDAGAATSVPKHLGICYNARVTMLLPKHLIPFLL